MLKFPPAPTYAAYTVQQLMKMGFDAFQKGDHQLSRRLEEEIEKRLQTTKDINAELQITVQLTEMEENALLPLSRPEAITQPLGGHTAAK